MRSLISCAGIVFLSSVFLLDNKVRPLNAADTPPMEVAKLAPQLNHKEVTIKFEVSELGGVSQRVTPGKPKVFVIEVKSEHEAKDLRVWIEGELADVLERLQLSFFGDNPIKKGTKIVATGSLTFSPGAGERKGHEWYTLNVDKWRNFRIVGTDSDK